MENITSFTHKMFKFIHGDTNLLLNTKILIVGVGGIGCEILKVLCKMPIGQVHIIDMDTIQLSNLNRQFLFKKQHKGQSKSLVARESVLQLNPDFNIIAHHKNVKELSINFFKQFHFIVMALDNIEARNYVNKIGVRLNIPIIDAGTLGYKGNVSTIIPNQTMCYSCKPKSAQKKVFPVCTIRMRPEKPIHCIVWAKLLFEVLFGPQNEDNDLKDLSQLGKKNNVTDIMIKLFESDILLIKNAKEISENKLSEIFAKSIKTISKEQIQNSIGSFSLQAFNKYEEKLESNQNISIFSETFQKLNQQKMKDSVIIFQKDDDNIIHFISSAANLRMYCFNIERQSFNEIKNMAGNIVPAIASTNSIVSGIQIVEMIKLMKNQRLKMKSYFVQNLNTKVIGLKNEPNLEACEVCHQSSIPVIVSTNFSSFTLQNLVQIIKQKCQLLQQFSINYGQKQFYNSEDPKQQLLQKSIIELCSAYEVDFVVTNQDTMKKACIVWLVHDEELKDTLIENSEKFNTNQQLIQEENHQIQNSFPKIIEDNDDIVIFDDDSEDQDLEIVEVKKNPESIKATNEAIDSNSQPFANSEAKNQENQYIQILVQSSDDDLKEVKISLQNLKNFKEKHRQVVQEDINSNFEQKESNSVKKKVKKNDDC